MPAQGIPACIGSILANEEPKSFATITICRTRSICLRSSTDILPNDTFHCRSFITASFRSIKSDNCACVGGACCPPWEEGARECASDSKMPVNLQTMSGFSSLSRLKAASHTLSGRFRIRPSAAATTYAESWTYRCCRSRNRSLRGRIDWSDLRLFLAAWPRHFASFIAVYPDCLFHDASQTQQPYTGFLYVFTYHKTMCQGCPRPEYRGDTI